VLAEYPDLGKAEKVSFSRLSSAPFAVISFHGGGILYGDGRIALVPESDAFAGFFAKLRQFGGSVLDASFPINRGRARDEIRRASVAIRSLIGFYALSVRLPTSVGHPSITRAEEPGTLLAGIS